MVITPACHAGGRGFKSLPPRQKITGSSRSGWAFFFPENIEVQPIGLDLEWRISSYTNLRLRRAGINPGINPAPTMDLAGFVGEGFMPSRSECQLERKLVLSQPAKSASSISPFAKASTVATTSASDDINSHPLRPCKLWKKRWRTAEPGYPPGRIGLTFVM